MATQIRNATSACILAERYGHQQNCDRASFSASRLRISIQKGCGDRIDTSCSPEHSPTKPTRTAMRSRLRQ
ncbi:hypothetical protein H6F67_19215 [Microcoleus sp. FACHB-1515]|nr:hypothetical protein [Microcoleus sp. FACHB-1515]